MSLRYELTGGFIKNAILSALSIAVSRDGETPLITQDDLLKGASLQLRGKLRMKVCILRELILKKILPAPVVEAYTFVVQEQQHASANLHIVWACTVTKFYKHLCQMVYMFFY